MLKTDCLDEESLCAESLSGKLYAGREVAERGRKNENKSKRNENGKMNDTAAACGSRACVQQDYHLY